MPRARFGKVAGQGGVHHVRHLFRGHVGGHRNHAFGPKRHHRHGQRIIPGENRECLSALVNDLGDLPE